MSEARRVREYWRSLSSREQAGVLIALSVLMLGLLYVFAVAPALQTLHGAGEAHARLDAELEGMRAQQQLAMALRAQPKLSADQAARAVEAAVRQHFGNTGWISLSGERATVRLTGVGGAALAQWLAEVRINARAIPTEARLSRTVAGSWDGTLVLLLPRG